LMQVKFRKSALPYNAHKAVITLIEKILGKGT